MERASSVVWSRLRLVCDDRVRQGCSFKLLNSEHWLSKSYHRIQLFSAFLYTRISSVSVAGIPLLLLWKYSTNWSVAWFVDLTPWLLKSCFLPDFQGLISHFPAVTILDLLNYINTQSTQSYTVVLQIVCLILWCFSVLWCLSFSSHLSPRFSIPILRCSLSPHPFINPPQLQYVPHIPLCVSPEVFEFCP